MPRYVQLNNWIFEVKAVRALRVDNYGDPYSAVAAVTVNGDCAYIDSLMTREQDDFTRDDFKTFRQFCAQLNVENFNYDRFKNMKSTKEVVKVSTPKPASIIRLVK